MIVPFRLDFIRILLFPMSATRPDYLLFLDFTTPITIFFVLFLLFLKNIRYDVLAL